MMPFEPGDTVVVTAASEESQAELVGKTGTVLRIISGCVTVSGAPYPPLFRVRFSPYETSVFWAEELEKSS